MSNNRQHQPILALKPAQIQSCTFERRTKARSLHYGRRLYRFECAGQTYWLKAQICSDSLDMQVAAQGLAREISFYQNMQNRIEGLLPYQFIEHELIIEDERFVSALVFADAEAYFACDPTRMNLDEVKIHLFNAIQLLERLYLHGYLHADLKQEHFVRYAGQVCLIDFEHVLDVHHPMTQPLSATPRYMAAELFHSDAKSLHSDIYALGIIIYEWLAGQRLQAKTYQDWAVLHCQSLEIHLPTQFQAFTPLLQGFLAKQKQQRLHDFSTIKRMLLIEIE